MLAPFYPLPPPHLPPARPPRQRAGAGRGGGRDPGELRLVPGARELPEHPRMDGLRRDQGGKRVIFFSPFEARISVSFHSFRLIFGRELISRRVLEEWTLSLTHFIAKLTS